MNAKILFVCIAAALAGLLFGYDVGVVSGALLYIKPYFNLDAEQVGIVVSAVPFGALIGALLCGKLSDIFGRKRSLIFTALLFGLGSIFCALANDVAMLVIGRCILGLAVGVGSFSAPLYLSELSHQRHRGGLVTLNQLAITLGILLAYVMNYVFSFSHAWRWMLGFGAIPAVVLFVLLWFLPKSPRWLMLQGLHQHAQKVLSTFHGDDYAKKEMQEIEMVLSHQSMSWLQILKAKGFRKVLGLGVMISILTQAVGINAIIYYAPAVLKDSGFGHNTGALIATAGIGLVNVLFTIVAAFSFG